MQLTPIVLHLLWLLANIAQLLAGGQEEGPTDATATCASPRSSDDLDGRQDGSCTTTTTTTTTTDATKDTQQPPQPTPAPHDLRGGYLRKMKYSVDGLDHHHVEHSLVYMDNLGKNHPNATTQDSRRLCKMYNLSARRLHLIRQDDVTKRFELIQAMDPVSTAGVTCTVGDHYIWLDKQQPQKPTHEVWIPGNKERHFVYHEPYESMETSAQRERYMRFQRGLVYEECYRNATGRSYLASSYPPRPPPQHTMWSADYVGQEHTVELDGVDRSLLVLSVAPRILIMDSFVSLEEIEEIQKLAESQGFAPSTTISPKDRHQRRTSETSWLYRYQHPVLRRLYQRTAQLLRMPNLTVCCAEDLQVVHYEQGTEYRAHFDFKLPGGWAEPARFATVLIYLNDCPHGGDTVFPLAADGPLSVQPQAGTALLFYSLLPDGNVDERSMHASMPVQQGTKRVSNIWVWDPRVDVTMLDSWDGQPSL